MSIDNINSMSMQPAPDSHSSQENILKKNNKTSSDKTLTDKEKIEKVIQYLNTSEKWELF